MVFFTVRKSITGHWSLHCRPSTVEQKVKSKMVFFISTKNKTARWQRMQIGTDQAQPTEAAASSHSSPMA
jgi:hypothetical protein